MSDCGSLRVTLVTGRTIDQGVAKEKGKTSKKYFESVAVCFIDPQDLKKLGIKEKTCVHVSTEHGSVVLKALKSARAPHPSTIYIPYGPWANAIVDPESDSIGMPSLKGTSAEIKPAGDTPILSLSELLKQQFRKK